MRDGDLGPGAITGEEGKVEGVPVVSAAGRKLGPMESKVEATMASVVTAVGFGWLWLTSVGSGIAGLRGCGNRTTGQAPSSTGCIHRDARGRRTTRETTESYADEITMRPEGRYERPRVTGSYQYASSR